MKRIIALLLAMMLTLSCLASCELLTGSGSDESVTADEAKELFAAALAALSERDGYVTETKVEISSDNEELDELIGSVGGKGITVWHDGDNFAAEYAVAVGEYDIAMRYVLIDDVLYREMLAYVGDEREFYLKERAEFDDERRSEVLRDAGAGVAVSLSDFGKVNPTLKDGKLTVEASEMNGSSLASLKNILQGRFSGSGASVIISDDIGYTAIIEDGVLTSTSIACEYTVILGGETYVIDAVITESYTYNDVVVSAPSGAGEYVKVDLDDIM